MSDPAGSIDTALANLASIKEGEDPRADDASDPLVLAREEVDRLWPAEVSARISERVPRERIHVGVARWKRKNGVCKYGTTLTKHRFGERVTGAENSTGDHTIIINEKILDDRGREEFLDTVRHELAHVAAYVDGSAGPVGTSPGHGPGWKKWARVLDAEPTACSNKKDGEAPYRYGCPNGHWTNRRYRRSEKIQNPGRWRCARCSADCVSWEAGDERPTEPGTCSVDCSDL